jgi:hypothetical protein
VRGARESERRRSVVGVCYFLKGVVSVFEGMLSTLAFSSSKAGP